MNSFDRILEKYRKLSFSERDKGDRFERLMQTYLQTDPKYAYRFKKVWLWNEFPGKFNLGSVDTGIDLVALTHEGDHWAIQCKCFQESATIDKAAVDTFLSTSSREFKNEQIQTVRFTYRLWISTTNKWTNNATESIKNQSPPVFRINLHDLRAAPVDWDKLEQGISGKQSRIGERELLPHQKLALEKTHEYFKTNNRGKLIMACGTGKTFNSLRIAEKETGGKGTVLFLVPSIALLGQILREWTTFAKEPINAICICSDSKVSRKSVKNDNNDSISVVDLALPASTNVRDIIYQFRSFKLGNKRGMTVVFSTYQSIEVIARTQKALRKEDPELDEFDLIICDEAHRTTGVTLSNEDESAFVKVHDNDFLNSKRRLYMTATPRLYSDDTKSRAAQAEAVLCSMDDEALYGKEIYRIGFGQAVEKDLLSDYKVLILMLNDGDIPPAVQKMIADKESEINTDDASKLIGCINALSKQVLGDEGVIKTTDPEPMRRAVAFCQSIAVSKKITAIFNTVTNEYIGSLLNEKKERMVSLESKHIDGTMSAPQRDEMLDWLKSDTDDNESRVLTNVRCLSEGVDVPSLDAVMFLSARNSQVDVVQSVGRVMRKTPGKKYGYIIIPVVVPSNVEAEKALNINERYKVVWTVLNALRAHDDRFNAIVNKIELNKNRPEQILVGRPETSFDPDGKPFEPIDTGTPKEIARQLEFQFEQLQSIVFARMVQKVGDRRYWEQWAKSVADIAARQVDRINRLIKDKGKHQKAFEKFLKGLQKNINPSIMQQEAVDMLSQHIITKPVFEALFEDYSFIKHNPISVSMQKMLDLLEAQAIEKDTETLQKFYESVKMRASGIDNAEGRQRIIVELYDKFFKTAFPKMVEKLGIVYTPVEVVDFILQSVNDVLKKEFKRSISDENIHILDPFTGTGTFITRLLQSGLIVDKDLRRKYETEIHANEIVLLAYYIAAVNIENAFHDVTDEDNYTAFDGICLTDTFQLGETEDGEKLFSEMFPQNSERVRKQKKAPLRVIMGNPPYSKGQKSANDNAQNQSYPKLDRKIAETYAALTNATNKNSLYNSYIKAFRWSSDRLDSNGGIICFVSDGAWLDGNSQDGFRKCLEKEFSSIYVFNLRGNQRTSGELSRREGGKIFGSGSRTPISITLLVKNPKAKTTKAKIHYHDIGDYWNHDEKLTIIKKFATVSNLEMKWKTINPNEHGDWLNQRNAVFDTFISLGAKDENNAFFVPGLYCRGLETSRDAWAHNYDKKVLSSNVKTSIDFFNSQSQKIVDLEITDAKKIKDSIDYDDKKISWSRAFVTDISNNRQKKFETSSIVNSIYRPFAKQHLYFSREFNNVVSRMDSFFPTTSSPNVVLCVPGVGVTNDFSCLITSTLPDLELIGKTQCFPLYYYEDRSKESRGLFDTDESGSDTIRRDGVSDFTLGRAKKQYGKNVTKEDIFYYVYGFLHSPEYRKTFANDLKKMLPRLPLVDDVRDFWAFSKAGRKLAELHLDYETVPAAPGVLVLYSTGQEAINEGLQKGEMDYLSYRVEKMRFPKKGKKDTIIYNSQITIENIPAKAYEYIVNGKSAIEWVMERYQITTHKASGIKNDPNDWAKEVSNPKYILDLLLSVINVSMQTVEIVEGLPKKTFC